MYKACYPYSSADSNVLSFQAGDELNLIEQIDEHWWSMLDTYGVAGLVPATYLEINKVDQATVLLSIEKSIKAANTNALLRSNQSILNETERRNLQKVMKNRQAIISGNSRWQNSSSSNTDIPQQPKRVAPKVPGASIKKGKSSKRYSAPSPPSPPDNSTSPRSPSNDSESAFADLTDAGTSSKIYSIQIKKGNVGPLQATENTQQSLRTSSLSSKSSDSYLVPVSKSDHSASKKVNNDQQSSRIARSRQRPDMHNSIDKQKEQQQLENENKLLQFQGKHITISRQNNESFSAIKSPEKTMTKTIHENKQKMDRFQNPVNLGMKGCVKYPTHLTDSDSISTISTGSFTSSVTSLPVSSKTLYSNRDEVYISDDLGNQLVDAVRTRCKTSFNKSLAAVRSVLHTLGTEIPSISNEITRIEKQIEDDTLKVHHGSLAEEDANRLYNVLERLTEHKEDSQQRNWSVHEDFMVIKDLLDQLITIMDEIDPSICRSVLEEDEFRYINDLVIYYQMEIRTKLRISLLHVFGYFCQLGKQFVSTLLCSVLPTEIAQDIVQDQQDILKFLSSTLMLTMIFSTGEPVPYHHYVQFNGDFIEYVLNTIEDPPDSDTEDQATDGLIAMLLAFNKHFKSPRNNTVMQAIANRKIFRTLTEKILLLINREVDPVAMFKFSETCPDSVLKFLVDIFAGKETSGIFFTNDAYVLIDIILRQIVDRSKMDKIRTEYLSLFHSILNTTNYSEHKHRAREFKSCFLEILKNEDSTESEVDIYIVKEIMTRFSTVFY